MKNLLLLIMFFIPSSVRLRNIDIFSVEITKIQEKTMVYGAEWNVGASCYQALPRQTSTHYWITASGAEIDTTDPGKHRWIAMSRDLLMHFCMGDTVVVEGTGMYDGEWIIRDKMNKRWKKKIDFLVNRNAYLNTWDRVTLRKVSSIHTTADDHTLQPLASL